MPKHMTLEHVLPSAEKQVELAVTGKAFNFLAADGQLSSMVTSIRIFARMQPQQKVPFDR